MLRRKQSDIYYRTLILSKNEENPKQLPMITGFGLFFAGGDGGNRNRVQNCLAKGSTSVVCYFGFPRQYENKHSYCFGRLLYLTETEPIFRSCSPLIDALS